MKYSMPSAETLERWSKVRTMKQLGCSNRACAAEMRKTENSFKKRWATLSKKYGW